MDYNITYRQKDKGWQYIISYKDDNGKWKQKSKQGFKNKKDAKPFAEEALKTLKKQLKDKKEVVDITYDSLSFKALADAFLEHNMLYKEYSTIKGYRNAIASFRIIWPIKVKEIKKININKCVDIMIEKKLKTVSIRTYIRKLKLVFDYYIENYDPNYENPIYNIDLPADKTGNTKIALTKAQLNKLLKQLKGNKFYIAAYIAGECGLRCGEILGLTWDDINRKNMTLNVNKQWKVLKDGKSNFGSLKTKNSNREVPISKKILAELDRYKESMPINADNRIAPFNKTSIDKYLNPKLRELAGISIHELRHTYATLLVGSGIDFKTIARILGHTVEMTLKTYSHVTDDMMKKASEKISKIF